MKINQQTTADDLERKTGLIDTGASGEDEPLALGISDEAVLRIIGKQVEEGEAYWNTELNLDEVRLTSEKYYIGDTYKEEDLYDFQIPYKNNRIITAIETLLPTATSQVPQPVVTEGNDTDESRLLAHDLEDVLLAYYEDLDIKGCFTMSIRHILEGLRVGVLKYYFDPDAGERLPDGSHKGAICVQAVRPTKVVFAARASDPDNIKLIAEYVENTIEELLFMFPDKKDEIFKHWGIKRGVRTQLAKTVGYEEVWFTYYDAKGEPQEALAWAVGDQLLLGAKKNPNWNYDEYEQQPDGKNKRLNFFDSPKKPYILINHLNLGKYVIDDTSLADQARPQQDILEKTGRQINENADQAVSGLVLNSNMISPEDAAKLIGDPTEKIMVDGDVREAAARLPYNMLPEYVNRVKQDARGEIDNIFGANAALRGEEPKSDVLGLQVLSQRANSGRLQTLTNAIEAAAAKLYPALVQMMKVYMDEPDIVRYTPAEGKTRFINWSSDKIEDGIKVRVKQGSAMPRDKESIRATTVQTMAVLDPLTLAEGLDMPNPKETAKRIVYYNFFMDKYLTEVLADDGSMVDPQAVADIQLLLKGQVPPVPEAPSKQYLATFERFLNSNAFNAVQDVTIKQNIVAFAKAINDKAKGGIGEPSTPISPQAPEAPTPAEAEGTVPQPGEATAPAAPAPAEGAQPSVAQTPTNGQNFVQRVVSRLRGQ